jgi:hypothetical protein
MLQLGGHHIAYNIVYNGNYVSGSPMFDGVEPVSWTDSGGATHAPLETQRAAMYDLQAAVSSISDAKLSGSFDDVLMGASSSTGHDTNYPQTYPTSGRGVLVSSLSSDQQKLVKVAIEAWVDCLPEDIADQLLLLYESDTNLASTYVGYAGTAGLTTQGSYIRIDGPRVWIEFVVQNGVAYPSGIHYHTIWRDKTADYGGSFASSSTDSSGSSGGTTDTSGGSTTTTGGTTTTTTTTTTTSSSSSSGGGGAPSLWFMTLLAGAGAARGWRRFRRR